MMKRLSTETARKASKLDTDKAHRHIRPHPRRHPHTATATATDTDTDTDTDTHAPIHANKHTETHTQTHTRARIRARPKRNAYIGNEAVALGDYRRLLRQLSLEAVLDVANVATELLHLRADLECARASACVRNALVVGRASVGGWVGGGGVIVDDIAPANKCARKHVMWG